MRAVVALLVPASLALGALAAAAQGSILKESIHVPRGWTRRARAPAEQKVNLRIGLRQGDFATLERRLYEVSDRACCSLGPAGCCLTHSCAQHTMSATASI
jgi:tripeptidyl-peptidase-1